MSDEETALIDMLAEHADSRVNALLEQAKQEFRAIADRALARALERYFRNETDDSGRDNGCCGNHRVA